MIHIDRNRLGDDHKPIRPSDKWFERALEATEEMKKSGKPLKFIDDLYGGAEPKRALEELFHRKCAYCETQLPELDFDVEHFRPKGAVGESSGHSGYYWLAYTWDNLFPSCKPCNQRRKDPATFTDSHNGPSAGKLDQFPVVDEGRRAISPDDDLDLEEPLLLNPCIDNPEEHIVYGLGGFIFPESGDQRGTESIRIFHLERKRLRDRRKDRLRDLQEAVQSGGSTAMYTRDDSAYAGMCRYALSDPDAFFP